MHEAKLGNAIILFQYMNMYIELVSEWRGHQPRAFIITDSKTARNFKVVHPTPGKDNSLCVAFADNYGSCQSIFHLFHAYQD